MRSLAWADEGRLHSHPTPAQQNPPEKRGPEVGEKSVVAAEGNTSEPSAIPGGN